MFKEKIFEGLKTKYSSLGLSKEVLEGVAAQLSTSVTEETQIEPAVNGAEGMLKLFQSYADSRVNAFKTESDKYKAEVEKLKAEAAKKQSEPTQGGNTKEGGEDFKALLAEALKPLTDKIGQLEADKKAEARSNFIASKVKELGIPDWRVKERFGITEDMDEAAISEYLSTVKQNIQTAGLGTKGGLPLDVNDKPKAEDVKSIVENLM